MKPYYSDAAVTIYHGDCREILPSLPHADLVFADPPWGKGFAYESFEDTQENARELMRSTFPMLRSAGDVLAITPGVSNAWALPEPPSWSLCWAYPKGNGRGPWGFTCWEPVMLWGADPYLRTGKGSRPDTLVRMHFEPNQTGHPCPKPLEVMRWILARCALPGSSVIDPFMGSGTTLRAAADLGMRAIGVELEERYCETAARRMDQQVLGLSA